MNTKSPINLWASFLANEKLDPKFLAPADTLILLDLAAKLALIQTPRVRPYKARCDCRKLVCQVAMDNGIDLTAIKIRGKMAMARSLLDAWNTEYQARFGTIEGTSGAREDVRRRIKMSLSKDSAHVRS